MGKKTPVMNEAQGKLRAMSLESFAKMTDENILRSGLINTAFSREVSPMLVRRMESGANFSLETEVHFQDEHVANFQKKFAEQKSTLEIRRWKEKLAEEDFKQEEAEFLTAKKKYEEAKARLDSAKNATSHTQKVVADCEAVYQKELERRQNMSKVVLLHASVTLAQLEQFDYYKFVVTHVDGPVLKRLGIADVVFDEEEAKLIEIEAEDQSLYADTTQMMLRSRLAYVRMVAWHMLNDIPYELAYADKVIDIILKHNGII